MEREGVEGARPRMSPAKGISRTTIAQPVRSRTNISLKQHQQEHPKDKELIHNGFNKLVSNFVNVNKISGKSSKTQNMSPSAKTAKGSFKSPGDMIAEEESVVLSRQHSMDKCTMTDFTPLFERRLQEASTVLSEDPLGNFNMRDMQWTDPRLLKKYLMNHYDEQLNDIADEDEAEIFCAQSQNYILRALYYFCTMSVSFVGSFCGITLITLILWKLLDDNILQMIVKSPPHDLLIRRQVAGFVSTIFTIFSAIFSKITRFLTISTREVLVVEEDVPFPWYRKFM